MADTYGSETSIIQSVSLKLGGRGDDIPEVVFTLKTISGKWEGFSVCTGLNLLHSPDVENLVDIMQACKVTRLEDLKHKLVKSYTSPNGTLVRIEPMKGIYKDD